jgi:hypothetical protein
LKRSEGKVENKIKSGSSSKSCTSSHNKLKASYGRLQKLLLREVAVRVE